jgi:hypothetical protein
LSWVKFARAWTSRADLIAARCGEPQDDVMSEMDKGQVEQRLSVRETGPFAAFLRLYSGRSLHCAVLNLSESGAKLGLAKEATLPKEFELCIPARNASWRVRVVWQQGKELGVCRV